MITPQSAILPKTGPHGLFLTLNVKGDAHNAVRHCAAVPALIASVQSGQDNNSLYATIGFGEDFLRKITPARPAYMKGATDLGPAHSSVCTQSDLVLHCHGERADLVFEFGRQFLAALGDLVDVVDDVKGFRYLESRDLTGFIDGTENPDGDERAVVALAGDEDPEFSGGSYMLVQRYVHDLRKWKTLSDTEQEKVIGRTKPDSIELSDDVRPDTAHISRVVIEEDGEELEILRHSMPYGEVSGDAGLLFLAYSRDLGIFEKMLTRMFGTTGGEPTDHLLDFTHPVSSAYFFAPSLTLLKRLAQ